MFCVNLPQQQAVVRSRSSLSSSLKERNYSSMNAASFYDSEVLRFFPTSIFSFKISPWDGWRRRLPEALFMVFPSGELTTNFWILRPAVTAVQIFSEGQTVCSFHAASKRFLLYFLFLCAVGGRSRSNLSLAIKIGNAMRICEHSLFWCMMIF